MIQEVVMNHERKHSPWRGPKRQLEKQMFLPHDEDSISPVPNNIQYTAPLCNLI